MRLSAALVAALFCATALVAAPAPAQSAGQASMDLPRREMNDEVFRNAKGWLIFKGDVEPGWNNRNVQVYKRLCKGCEWKLAKLAPTNGEGRWRTRIYAPPTGSWYWKGVVPKAGGYGRSVTRIWRTFVE